MTISKHQIAEINRVSIYAEYYARRSREYLEEAKQFGTKVDWSMPMAQIVHDQNFNAMCYAMDWHLDNAASARDAFQKRAKWFGIREAVLTDH